MRVWVLGSGSSGNAVLVESGENRVLVDAGFGTRTIAVRLKAIGVEPESIEACVVTHEHTDHICGAAGGAHKWGWSLFASCGTLAASEELQGTNCKGVLPGESVTLSRVIVTTYPVPHDSRSPIGVRVASIATGANAVVCTDVGHVNAGVRALCRTADILIIESNHDEGMLRAGPYPPSVQARIASRLGHLSNREAAALARDMVHRDLAHVVLSHLSEPNNDATIAHRTAADALRGTKFHGRLSLSPQDRVVGPFAPRAGRAEPGVQFALAL